jgi:hypothetical protein
VSSYHHTGCNTFYRRASLSQAALTDHHSPSIKALAKTLLADTTLLRLFIALIIPYIHLVWGYNLSFEFFNPDDGTDSLSPNVGKKLPITP